ncbi:MAG TPA: LapA family protein [Candidatus Limnocylindrales bacterium]|nr:LapA family protein [Candidatus Limnocylindrales bacterium]
MTGPPERRRGGLSFGGIVAFVLGALVVVFAVVNLTEVRVNFLVFSVALPLFLLIIGIGAVGFIVGVLLRGRGR